MRPISYVIIDVFTKDALKGNPVAVLMDATQLSTKDMQRIAKEMNLSETTFILPAKKGGNAYVRIFTPVNELPFAGHPTLGTAFVLADMTQASKIKIETAIGTIPFKLDRNKYGKTQSVQMEQPIPTWKYYEHSETVLRGLSLNSSILPIEIYHNGPRHVFIGLPTLAALSSLKPDLNILSELEDVAINCFAGKHDQWRMRMFSPAYGVAEDAATGSAAGPLALHLARHGYIDFGQWVSIEQGVEMGRHSMMHACVTGTIEQINTIYVAGSAVIIARGELLKW